VIWKEWVAGLVFIEEASYIEFPEPEEKVFHQVNGEILVDSSPELMEREREYIATFRVPGNQFGHWHCAIFRAGERYYLVLEWVPKEGYSWEESVVYRLREL